MRSFLLDWQFAYSGVVLAGSAFGAVLMIRPFASEMRSGESKARLVGGVIFVLEAFGLVFTLRDIVSLLL